MYHNAMIKVESDHEQLAERKDVLLKACYDIIKKCNEGRYVKNVLEQTAFYDDTDCDGFCLANDIAEIYNLPELT